MKALRGARVFNHRAVVRVRRNGTHWRALHCGGGTEPDTMTPHEIAAWCSFAAVLAVPVVVALAKVVMP